MVNHVKILLLLLMVCIWFNSVVKCFEKICGEFWSIESQHGSFDSIEISKEIEHLNRNNITEPTLCLYKFIAQKNQKVKIEFSKFDVKSYAPECQYEYVDIYIELNEDTLYDYLNTNFLSRWCGVKKPNLLISYHNIILFAYHTDGRFRESTFSGTYEFIDASIYEINKINSNTCEYEFKSSLSKSGMFMSPTYPGTYPNYLDCKYKFIGDTNERVSIYFEELAIFYGAEHCPYDSLKVFDFSVNNRLKKKQHKDNMNTTLNRELLDIYCGHKTNFTIYSSKSLLEINFEASDSLNSLDYGTNQIQLRKGFRAFYRFDSAFIDLKFITGFYIKGTYCDQLIVNYGLSNGLIYSPSYSHPQNASCKYIFQGSTRTSKLEVVKLNFQIHEIKQVSNCSVKADYGHFIECLDLNDLRVNGFQSKLNDVIIIVDLSSLDKIHFKAQYEFVPNMTLTESLVSKSTENYYQTYRIQDKRSSGSILITNNLNKFEYVEWFVSTKPDYSFLVTIRSMNLIDEDCSHLKLVLSDLNSTTQSKEYCLSGDVKHMIIDSSNIKIEMIKKRDYQLLDGTIQLSWVNGLKNEHLCEYGFRCLDNKYCIDALNFCDRVSDCFDSSDESYDCNIRLERTPFPFINILTSLAIILSFIILIATCMIYKLNSLRKKNAKSIRYAIQPLYYKYSPTNSMDYLEAAITTV